MIEVTEEMEDLYHEGDEVEDNNDVDDIHQKVVDISDGYDEEKEQLALILSPFLPMGSDGERDAREYYFEKDCPFSNQNIGEWVVEKFTDENMEVIDQLDENLHNSGEGE